MLEAKHFTVFTDHKPLTYVFMINRDKSSPRRFHYLDYISQFTTDLQYVAGKANVVADALLRIEAISGSINYEKLARSQATDLELQELLQNGTALKLKRLETSLTSMELYCDVSTAKPQPYVDY